jgi:hypothetical protein
VRRAALVFVAACGAATATTPVAEPTSPAPRSAPEPAVDVISKLATNVHGRVELDGKPVTYFGIAYVESFARALPFHVPLVFRSADGTFAASMPWGHWDLIIVAPGAARHVIAGVDVGEKLDLGTISLGHGNTLTGVVRDETGQPVPDARVAFISDKRFTEFARRPNELERLLHGNLSTRTDANGHYTIRGTTRELLRTGDVPSLVAHASARRSFPVHAPAADANVDLQVVRTGTIDVTVTGSMPKLVVARAHGVDVFAEPAGGEWRFEQLPAGTYDVSAYSSGMRTWAHQPVAVQPDAATTVALALPAAAPVEVTITSTKAACSEIQLRDVREHDVAVARCASGVATFPKLAPGAYLACIDKHECHAIAVDETPAQQKFTLVP